MATLGTTAQLDSALRREFSGIGARPKPETKMTDVIAALATLGVTPAMDDGLLVLKQGDTIFNTGLALRNFANRAEFAHLFVTAADNPHDWTTAMKLDYIREHGADAWARKSNAPVLTPAVGVLDQNMSYADYQNLTRAERVAFIREFGADAVSRIHTKKRK
jgi:hypothetical protein